VGHCAGVAAGRGTSCVVVIGKQGQGEQKGIEMETKLEHTPGPWRAYRGRGTATSPHYVTTESGMIPIAQTGRYDLASWADARLIAAAPDLLAACNDLLQEIGRVVKLDVRKHFSLMVQIQAARAAIAKAQKGD